jgi:hypothetical protein
MTEAWAAIIAAVIGVIGTVLATKFDDVVNLFRRPSRKIAGDWSGSLTTVDTDPENYDPLEIEYTLTIAQTGITVKATMVETRVSKGREPYKHTWKGKVTNDFLIFQSSCDKPERFMVAAGLLHISATGQRMRGYYAANAGAKASSRTLVGYTELVRI